MITYKIIDYASSEHLFDIEDETPSLCCEGVILTCSETGSSYEIITYEVTKPLKKREILLFVLPLKGKKT